MAFIVLIVLACFVPHLHSQDEVDLRHLTLSTWTTAQGLPQNFILAIDQTPDGFLWIGTKGGLARFDGLNFRTSFAHEIPALHSSVNGIAHDAAGRLWVTTNLGFLCEHDDIWTQIPLPVSGSPQPGHLVAAHDGSVLIGIADAVWKFDPHRQSFSAVQGASANIRGFAEDRNGNLWLTNSQAVIEIKGKGEPVRYPLRNASIIVAAGDGQIYAGDGHRVFRFDGVRFTRIEDPGTEESTDMTVSHDGSLWMASGGLEGLSRKTQHGVERFGLHEGLLSNDVRTLFEDRDGAMWIGTISGLQRLRRGAFIPYSRRDGLVGFSPQYDAIFEASDRSIWTGTSQDGISVFRGGRWKTFGHEVGVRRGQVRGFVEDGAMPLVAIADYGLFRWNGRRYAKLPGLPDGYITSPIRTANGDVWFSVVRHGVYRLHHGTLEHFATAQGLTDPMVWCLLPDRNGGLWAGASSGLFHFADNRWKQAYAAFHVSVLTLTSRSSGELLAGTPTGVAVFSADTFKTFGRNEGLPSDPVLQLVEDREGNIWIATGAGLSSISKSDFDNLLSGRSLLISPQLFTDEDGLPSRDLLPLSHELGLLATDGRLWFATNKGPASGHETHDPAPRALPDDVLVDGIIQPKGAIQVRPGRHRLTFLFTAPSFIAPEFIRFRYRLMGWDTGWIDAGQQREASYAGLSPGSYSFEVQAIGRGGNVGPIARIPSVELVPYFWQMRWFLIVSSLLAIVLIVELTRRRTMLRARRMSLLFQERAAERERIAHQIHDTVIQDLIGATLYLEIAEMELAAGVLDPSKPLEGLAARLRESIARSRSMVSNLHSTALPEYGLLDVLRLAEAEFRLGASPAFSLSYSGTVQDVDPLLRDEVYRICRESIANAFRHAEAKNIKVLAEFGRHSLAVEIADDGLGMDDMLQQRGRAGHFGLHAMRAHAERIGATLTIASAPGQGTVVRLSTRSSWQTRVWSSMQAHIDGIILRLRQRFSSRKKIL